VRQFAEGNPATGAVRMAAPIEADRSNDHHHVMIGRAVDWASSRYSFNRSGRGANFTYEINHAHPFSELGYR
jgi:hypothetical protein